MKGGNVRTANIINIMPKETFLKLSKEKQNKVINSAKEEFTRVPLQEVSIKNIVENAGIARGSFYQYFESKEDLLKYILKEKIDKINQKLQDEIQEKSLDLFECYIFLYNLMIETFVDDIDRKFFKQIFENLKSSDENIFNLLRWAKPHNITEYYEILDKSNLRIENKEDFETICDMLNAITKRAIIKNFKCNLKDKNEKQFLNQIEYLKYGIIKKEEKND